MFRTGQDALGRTLQLPVYPERVISLVPSLTELLLDLGIGERLVGRTRYCIHPSDEISKIAVIGGTKKMDLATVRLLRPDLFIAEKEETPQAWADALSAIAPVYVTQVTSIPTALTTIESLGALVGLPAAGAQLAADLRRPLEAVRGISSRPERVLYLIWKKPWMAAGSGTFIHSCLEHVGFRNAATELNSAARYPELTETILRELRPDRIFLSSEPFPFGEKHIVELQAIDPRARIQLVEGELWSWYGSRMQRMPAYWREIVHALA